MKTLPTNEISALFKDWIDDKLPRSQEYQLSQFVLSVSPDVISIGRGTYFVAAKNRNANAMLIPDLESVSLPPAIQTCAHLLAECFKPRGVLVLENKNWVRIPQPSKTWAVAPVDQFLSELLTCDLATLLPHTLPVLERGLQRQIRRYARLGGKDPYNIHVVDQDWSRLVSQHAKLGVPLPDGYVSKRLMTLAKQRLSTCA